LLKSSLDKFYSPLEDLTNSEEINITENTSHLVSRTIAGISHYSIHCKCRIRSP
jgi:hypothetical protein